LRPRLDFHPSLRHLLQRVDVERLIGHDPLQPLVLTLQLPQALGIVGLHRAVLVAPPVIRVLADLEVPRDLDGRLALGQHAIGLAQLADDLLRRVPASRHARASSSPTILGA
jgi:hypothetical protein